jgi:pimeloyl-ACP methyl ester carboxylesterase
MRAIWIAALALAALAWASPGRAEELIKLPTRSGVEQPFYLTLPEGPPVASLMLFPGSEGKLSGYGPADINRGNFLVRTRNLFVARGFAVAVMDVPSDEGGGMSPGFRVGAAHRTDIAAVIAYLRQKMAVPVWLVGTSMGTLSAANGATLEAGGADGVVLTSSVVRTSKRVTTTVFDTGPGRVKIPTLIVHNRDDACVVCPFSEAPGLLSRYTASPRKELIAVAGGSTTMSEPCEALSRHGYIGIEQQVVSVIGDWIKASK